MKKWNLFLDLDTEEAWLNHMQATGYRLVDVHLYSHRYTFAPVDSGESPAVRIDFRNQGMSKRDYQDYRQLFADSGWTWIAGSRHGGMQYFEQADMAVAPDIFSDQASKVRNRQQASYYSLFFGLLFFAYAGYMIYTQFGNWSGIFNAKSWYLTPGLWQMSGGVFWRAWLFETPFALMRIIPIYLLFGISGYYSMRFWYSYRQSVPRGH